MVYQLVHGKTPSAEAASLMDNLLDVDGDYDKVAIADTTPDGGMPISNTQFVSGRPILPDYVPTRLKRHRPSYARKLVMV